MQDFFFKGWITFHCIYMHTPCFLYPLIHQWTFRWFPYLGYWWIMLQWRKCRCLFEIMISLISFPLVIDVSISWLVWIILQWTWEWKCLFEILISFPWDIYPEGGLLDHMKNSSFNFGETSVLFAIMIAAIYIPTNSIEGLPFLHSLTNTYIIPFW